MTDAVDSALTEAEVDTAIGRAISLIEANVDRFGDRYPDDTTTDGVYQLRARPGWAEGANVGWTTGFWAGLVWLAFERTGDEALARAARGHVASFAQRLEDRIDIDTHDLGFLYTLSCLTAVRFGDDGLAERTGLAAADRLLDRYLSPPGIIQAWGALDDPAQRGRTIIDSLMNMPLLHWAGRVSGQPHYGKAARRHTDNVRANIFREDGSTYHTFYWDTDSGHPIRGGTEQGSADDSCWARGQAWGIYGFALNHRLTGEPSFLAAARTCADYLIDHLDDDLVPHWDLALKGESGTWRDSSAAAIAVAGLLEIDEIDPDARYRALADRMLAGLARRYVPPAGSDSNALLLHGVYNAPKGVGVDEGTLWGDYFYLESLLRLADPTRPSFWRTGQQTTT